MALVDDMNETEEKGYQREKRDIMMLYNVLDLSVPSHSQDSLL